MHHNNNKMVVRIIIINFKSIICSVQNIFRIYYDLYKTNSIETYYVLYLTCLTSS